MRRILTSMLAVGALVGAVSSPSAAQEDDDGPGRSYERIGGLPSRPAQLPLGLDGAA